MKWLAGWFVYSVVLVLVLKTLVASLGQASIWESAMGIAVSIVLWWIGVAIGNHLGVTPRDYLAGLRSGLRIDTRPPERPSQATAGRDEGSLPQ